MTLPIDAVAVGSMATGTAIADSAAVGVVVELVVDPAQAVSETEPARLRIKMTFRIKFLMNASPSW
jgi:hypothetical protein